MSRIVQIAFVLVFISGCAQNKVVNVTRSESAIDFTHRISIELSSKLDKLIQSALISSPVDRGEYTELKTTFFPVYAGLAGVLQGYQDLCKAKGGLYVYDFCQASDRRVIFNAVVRESGVVVQNGEYREVVVLVREPKSEESAELQRLAAREEAERQKAIDEGNEKDQRDKLAATLQERSSAELRKFVKRGDTVCSGPGRRARAYDADYVGYVEEITEDKYRILVRGTLLGYAPRQLQPGAIEWSPQTNWVPCDVHYRR